MKINYYVFYVEGHSAREKLSGNKYVGVYAMSMYEAVKDVSLAFDEDTTILSVPEEVAAGSIINLKELTEERNTVHWKDVFISSKILSKNFHECAKIASSVGYKYMLFNGLVYNTQSGELNKEYCHERDIVLD